MTESTFRYENVEITWLKHAGFRIKNSVVIYIDPYEVTELEKADLILITHDHFDHLDMRSIRILAKSDTIVVHPKGCVVEGYKTYEISIGETTNVKGVEIKAVPAYNIDKPYHKKGCCVGYVVKVDNVRIYHAGDTDRIPEMKEIEVDIALFPIGGTYTMDVDEAIEATKDIKAKFFIPMHYGEIGLKADPGKFKASVENAVILKPSL
ncbi:MAG: MBL fold metallo-hydrolase [Archaeoglobales archaeon]|nr:MAG: MBL fold metallo-hydrolase [Archaeoglobales archaeon]